MIMKIQAELDPLVKCHLRLPKRENWVKTSYQLPVSSQIFYHHFKELQTSKIRVPLL
jgi:hypothetical protein